MKLTVEQIAETFVEHMTKPEKVEFTRAKWLEYTQTTMLDNWTAEQLKDVCLDCVLYEITEQISKQHDSEMESSPEITKLSGSEAVYGLLAWLTTRKEAVTFSSHDDAAIAAQLADQFCKTNGLDDPRDRWEKNLTHPKPITQASKKNGE